MRLLDDLPDIYQGLLPPLFEREVPPERNAPCSDCAMCAPADAPPLPGMIYFRPNAKCCTFHPRIPNYLIGGVLTDDSPEGAEGRRRVLERIEARTGVSPFGVAASSRYDALYSIASGAFGRSATMLCPYFERDAGNCTVWRHRESVCSTFFCKHLAGADGQEFWDAVKRYMTFVQRSLTVHVLMECGFDAEFILASEEPSKGLDARAIDDLPPDDAGYAATWAAWAGRETELFRRAAEIVQGLTHEDLARLGGNALELRRSRVEALLARMLDPAIPDVLVRNPHIRVGRAADGSYVVSAYSASDTSRLREEVFRYLDAFDGMRPTADVLADMRERTGLVMSTALLRRLFQHRLLIDARRPGQLLDGRPQPPHHVPHEST